MGWSIECIENTLEISEECGSELEALDLDLDGYSPRLEFVTDHMEHMDIFRGYNHHTVMAILENYKVNGRVCFGCLEGEESGSFWGYEWKDGEVIKLTGRVVFDHV